MYVGTSLEPDDEQLIPPIFGVDHARLYRTHNFATGSP